MRNHGIDLLRGIASFFIVGVHLQLINYTSGGQLLLHFCDMNVGVFAALAGYMMANSAANVKTDGDWLRYVLKRAKRLLPLYFIWSVIFLLASAVFQIVLHGAIKLKYADSHFWIFVIIWGAAATHLWFIVSLFYAQSLFCVILNRVLPIIWLCVSAALLIVSVEWQSWYAIYPIRLLSFLLYGYCLSKVPYRLPSSHLCFVMVGALVIHVVAPIDSFYRDWLATGPIILFFANVRIDFMRRLSSFLGGASMGVYLIHPLMTVGISTLVKGLWVAPYGFVPIASVWIGAWVLSVALTVVILRSEKVCWLVK